MKKIKLSNSHLSNLELKYISKAIDSNEVSTYGENLFLFENELENYLGNNHHVTATVSGTSAIHLALILAGVKRNDEVICQSFTFAATVNPILYLRAVPIFIDSCKDNLNMCPFQLEIAIKESLIKGKKPKAVIVVHSYGMPAKMDEIISVCKKYEIKLIEDAAAALGAQYKGGKCGALGDFGVFSFNGNKIITTGAGGALVCKSIEDKKRAIFLSTQAKEDKVFYEHKEVGYNYRMSNINASIGRGQIHYLEQRIKLRKRNHLFYQSFFEKIKGLDIFSIKDPSIGTNYWLNCINVTKKQTGFSNENLRVKLKEDNIESRFLWKPMHLQPIFKNYPYYGGNVSEKLFKSGLCLPSGSDLSLNDLNKITESIDKIL
mgnify:FL=1